MKLKRVRIQNFRCLEDVEISFENVTTFIGPNGVGKSSVLRALDWFFNGDRAVLLTDEDVYDKATERRIRVEAEFGELSAEDRAALAKYAESRESVVIWRTWDGGPDKITGKAFAYPPFEEVRRLQGAMDKRDAYKSLRQSEPALELPPAASAQAVETAMSTWERDHRDALQEAEISDTNFFGFAGQGKMSGLFDYVLVTADLRASEETQDSRSAVLGKILERAVDRTAADEELVELADQFQHDQSEIHARHFGPQLEDISKQLSDEVSAFTRDRSIKIKPLHVETKPPRVQFSVTVLDHETETRVDRQGHGFQRALLIAALKLLAERGAGGGSQGVICLAIEEPELFQHPVQARAFASVLRQLAEATDQSIQITYATHSPCFIEPTHFDQIRRVSRRVADKDGEQSVTVASVTLEAVIKNLDGYIKEETVRKRLDDVCLARLPEALFGEAVILVEGDTDRAVIEGCGEHDAALLAVDGIVAAEVGGKDILLLPCAILTLLGIPCLVVFDGDKGCPDRMRQDGKQETDILVVERDQQRKNSDLMRYLGEPEQGWPATQITDRCAVFEDRLEQELAELWPAWVKRRDELVESGLGFHAKNAATYRHAAATAEGEVPYLLQAILEAARRLRPHAS
jgi:putative ATP-dependent endonuclease of the OLD family